MRNTMDDQGIDNSNHMATAGFSLVELLVVLAIIGLIAGLALPQVLRYLGSARVDTARTQIKNVDNALELYFLDNSAYPSTDQGLSALSIQPTDAPSWRGPYIKKADQLTDPWNRRYIYQLADDGGTYEIKSLGRDGKTGGEGEDQDVSN